MLIEYISQNYMTLMLLAGLGAVMFANRRTKLEGVEYIKGIIGLVFIMTLLQYAEYACEKYRIPVKTLYVKAALSYAIDPLLIILELYLIAPVKHKLLILLPYAAELVIIIADLFGAGLICTFTEDYHFISGRLHFVPAVVLCFYILLLLMYSLRFVKSGEHSKALIVYFISTTTIITVWLEYTNTVSGHTNEIAAMEILIYYFYLAVIHHGKVQQKLHDSELELERRSNELLMAQIQPHFINNSLLAIQSRCIDYPEIYDSMKNFSRYLRSNFDNIGSNNLITFRQELRNIKAYLSLEKMNFGDRLKIEYDIESDDFMLPALTVEPLVENAVRHAVAAREKGGIVQIIQRDEEDGITIDVRDIGFGSLNLTEKQEKRRGIGIANVRSRLEAGSKGKLELIPERDGTCARITLSNVVYASEEAAQ